MNNNITLENKAGILYIVAMPIGNRDDITLRALHVLSNVDYIAAEDTRIASRFLSGHDIKGKYISYFEHNERDRSLKLIRTLLAGNSVAIVSSAGTPSISDPGYRLVKEAITKNIRVIPIPGVSAVVTSLSVSGLPTDSYLFAGFLPRKKGKRHNRLKEYADYTGTIVIYESPKRTLSLISELIKMMGDRQAVLAREMTKPHEEFLRGRLSEIHDIIRSRKEVKGECTLLIHGSRKTSDVSLEMIVEKVKHELKKNETSLSKIVKKISKQYDLSKSIVYQTALMIKEEDQD